jgi:hypothetical protein
VRLCPLPLAFVLALETISKTVSAADDPHRVGDAAGRLAVAEIYCAGHITKKGRAYFSEVRKQSPQAFAQGVLEGSNSLARGYVLGLDACIGVAARFGKTGTDYQGLWRLDDR